MGKAHVQPLTPAKSDKTLAIKAFKEFFKQATGKDWKDRADGKLPDPKTDKDGNILPPQEGWYTLEGTGNLFTDWMKSYQAPDESEDKHSATGDLPATSGTEAELAENGHTDTASSSDNAGEV